MRTRGGIHACTLLAAVVALIAGFFSESLILVVLGVCPFLALAAQFALPKNWPRIKIMVCGGLAGTFLTMLAVVYLLPADGLRAAPGGNLQDGDVFIAFGLGLGPDSTPGLSNLAIARWILANNPKRLPTIAQEGTARALKELEKSQPELEVDSWLMRLPHDPLVYVDTRQAARQAQAIMKEKGFRRPVLVSHDLQLQRMAWNFEGLGLAEGIIVPDMPAIPFDPNSVQHWGTRSKSNWVLVERYFSRPIMAHDLWVWLVTVLGAGIGAAICWRAPRRKADMCNPPYESHVGLTPRHSPPTA